MKLEYLYEYWFQVKVYDQRGQAYGVIDYISWKNMSLEFLSRWRWYFDYRAALLKVKNPRCTVESSTGKSEPSKKTVIDFLNDKIRGKKKMVTQLSNQIKKHKDYLIENNIFGLDGDDGRLAKAEEKLCKYKQELQEAEDELKLINN